MADIFKNLKLNERGMYDGHEVLAALEEAAKAHKEEGNTKMTKEREKEIREITAWTPYSATLRPLIVRDELLAELDRVRAKLDLAVKALEWYTGRVPESWVGEETLGKIRGDK